jgi:hypothetical protein
LLKLALITKEKESECEGWKWHQTPNGKYGWYPINYVKVIDEKPGQFELLRYYNPKELSIQAGEAVTIQFEESGWAWVVKHSVDKGLVPLDNLEAIM